MMPVHNGVSQNVKAPGPLFKASQQIDTGALQQPVRHERFRILRDPSRDGVRDLPESIQSVKKKPEGPRQEIDHFGVRSRRKMRVEQRLQVPPRQDVVAGGQDLPEALIVEVVKGIGKSPGAAIA